MIKRTVEGIIERFNTNNIYDICDGLNIKLIKVDKFNPILLSDNSLYVRNYFCNQVIFIRDDLDLEHEKYYLAHELGHALLHLNMSNTAYPNRYRQEREANIFALLLLNLECNIEDIEGMSLDQINSYFMLPKDAFANIVQL